MEEFQKKSLEKASEEILNGISEGNPRGISGTNHGRISEGIVEWNSESILERFSKGMPREFFEKETRGRCLKEFLEKFPNDF